MLHAHPEDWQALERIERGDPGTSPEAVARLTACGLLRALAADRYELTPQGWHALRQHRRLDPD